MTDPEDGADVGMLETPQIMDVAVNFKPILNVLPQTGLTKNNSINTPIILAGGIQASTTAYKVLNNR